MKTLLRLLPFLALAFISAHAADEKLLAAVRAADDERVAATIEGKRARLEAIYSNELHYAHSSGVLDTKASYIQSLVTRSTVYVAFDYKQRDFKLVAPGLVLMTGRALIKAGRDGEPVENDLNYLAVWREENGKWRFLAWQSCRNPPAVPAATK